MCFGGFDKVSAQNLKWTRKIDDEWLQDLLVQFSLGGNDQGWSKSCPNGQEVLSESIDSRSCGCEKMQRWGCWINTCLVVQLKSKYRGAPQFKPRANPIFTWTPKDLRRNVKAKEGGSGIC